eukprot:1138839-Pelagomonas_calceolata.AAC.10
MARVTPEELSTGENVLQDLKCKHKAARATMHSVAVPEHLRAELQPSLQLHFDCTYFNCNACARQAVGNLESSSTA